MDMGWQKKMLKQKLQNWVFKIFLIYVGSSRMQRFQRKTWSLYVSNVFLRVYPPFVSRVTKSEQVVPLVLAQVHRDNFTFYL
jgi:hypothetical protein